MQRSVKLSRAMLSLSYALSGRAAVAGIVGLAGALAVVAYVGKPTMLVRPQSPPARPSLAVVPFESLSGGPELELLSAEVTEAVHERLSRLEDGPFELRPREEGVTFRGLEGGVEAVARALGARYVLTGSVNETRDSIEVDAYLVRVERETRVWAERFTWPMGAEAAIPDELAARVAEALQDVR